MLRDTLPARAEHPALHLPCVIPDRPGALSRPSTYPPVGEDNSDAAQNVWFADLVGWWQDDVVAEGKPFTDAEFAALLALARAGIGELVELQKLAVL